MDKDIDKYIIKLEFFKHLINKFSIISITGIICITFYKIMISLAGKNTIANIGIEILADIKFMASLAYGGTATALYLREKKAKEKIIKQKSKQIEELEKQLDPRKQSSGLTEKGCTNKKDL